MKKFILILFLAIKLASAVAQQGIPSRMQLPDNVGDIAYNPARDKPPSFLRGNEHIAWYYGVNTSYKGGKKAMLKIILNRYKYRTVFKQVNGYITIKFVVNSIGETDRFRIFQR